MSLGYQARASQRVLSRLGQDALLNGVAAGKVNLARQVQIDPGIGDTANDNFVARFDVATISKLYNPRVGKVLTHPDGTFVLDRLVDDNGHNARFIIVAAA